MRLSLGVVHCLKEQKMLAHTDTCLLFCPPFGPVFAVANLLVLSSRLRFRSNDERQKMRYECGMGATGTPYVPMDINFYIFAALIRRF